MEKETCVGLKTQVISIKVSLPVSHILHHQVEVATKTDPIVKLVKEALKMLDG